MTKLRKGNLAARIRTNVLYDFAAANNGLVVGTCNCDEWEIGNEDDAKGLSKALERIWEVATRLRNSEVLKELYVDEEIAWWLDKSPIKVTEDE